MTRIAAILLMLALPAWGLPQWVMAQEPRAGGPRDNSDEDEAPRANKEGPSRPVQEALPPLHLRDKDGRLVPVPGVSLEEFERLLNLRSQLEDRTPRPRYSVQRFLATGTAQTDRALLRIECDVLVQSEDWVRVPLRLAEGVITQEPTFEGEGEHFLDFSPEDGGYVLWIKAEAGSQQRLILEDVSLPLRQVSGQTRLRLNAPRATQSELKLDIPRRRVQAQVTGSAQLDRSDLPGSEGGTQLLARRCVGEVELTWRDAPSGDQLQLTDLEATGLIDVRFDGQNLRWNAQLSIRSLGPAFQVVRVRLPAGARLVKGEIPSATVQELKPENPAGQRTLEFTLDQSTTGTVDCRILAEQPYEPALASSVELGGFEVVGAIRQWGHLAVSLLGEWDARWSPDGSAVRRVDNLPDALRRDDVAAGFEYARIPYSLAARIVPRRTQIDIEPEYLFFVSADGLRLEGRLKATVRGAKAQSMVVDLPPHWELDELGPENLINAEEISVAPEGTVTAPFSRPVSGSFELSLKAHRQAPLAQGNVLEWNLPTPHATRVRPAAVILLPDDNLAVRVLADRSIGITRQPTIPDATLPARQQPPLFYRGEVAAARVAVDRELQTQSLAARVSTLAQVERDAVAVEQRLNFRIEREAAQGLTLQAPRRLADLLEKIECELDGRRLALQTLPADDQELVTLRLALPEPRLGDVPLVVRYRWSLGEMSPDATTIHHLPLAMPSGSSLESNELTLRLAPGVEAQGRDARWTWDRSREGYHYLASDRVPEIDLAMDVASEEREPSLVIERAWIQSWLSSNLRADRAVYRFTTQASEIIVTLPEGVRAGEAQVLLDGTVQSPTLLSGGRLSLAIAPVAEGRRRHLLELLYRFDSRPARGARLALDAPRFSGKVWVQRSYWQLIVPRDEHLFVAPRNMAAEYHWSWQGWGFARQAAWEQRQLEGWLGAPRRAAPPETLNVYLFSAQEDVSRLSARLVSRSLLVMTFSFGALGLGLLLLHLSVVRRATLLLVGGIVLSATMMLFPDQAILAAQGAVLGIVLWMVAAAVDHFRKDTRPVLVTPPSPSGIVKRRGAFASEGSAISPRSTMSVALEASASSAQGPNP